MIAVPHEKVGAVVASAVGLLLRKGAPGERDDLSQEGLRIAYQALSKMPSTSGKRSNPMGYVYIAVRRELGNYLSRNLAVPSIGGDWKVARSLQGRVDPDVGLRRRASPEPSPEDALLARERTRLGWRRGIDLRRALARFLDEDERRIVDRLFGLDGLAAARPRVVARELGIDVREVYRVRSKMASRGASCVDLFRLREAP